MSTITLDADLALQVFRVLDTFRSHDDGRPVLEDIHIELYKGIASLIATDAYRLVVIEMEAKGRKGSWDLPGELVTRLLKLTKGTGAVPEALLTIEQSEVKSQAKDGVIERHVSAKLPGASLDLGVGRNAPYPDWRKLLGGTDDADPLGEGTAFNPRYLADLAVLDKAFGYESKPAIVKLAGPSMAARFELYEPVAVSRAVMYLMPVRLAA